MFVKIAILCLALHVSEYAGQSREYEVQGSCDSCDVPVFPSNGQPVQTTRRLKKQISFKQENLLAKPQNTSRIPGFPESV